MFPNDYSYENSKREFVEVMGPSVEEELELQNKGLSAAYWGAETHVKDPMKGTSLTPLRENLLLLMAAYKDQL